MPPADTKLSPASGKFNAHGSKDLLPWAARAVSVNQSRELSQPCYKSAAFLPALYPVLSANRKAQVIARNTPLQTNVY